MAAGAGSGATLAGVEMPDTITVDGTPLLLNGMGLRKAYGFKAYVGGLYVEQRSSDPSTIIDPARLKRVTLHFLRDIDRGRLASGWMDSLRNRSGGSMESAITQFGSLIADVKTGDVMTFTSRPGVGVEVALRGTVRGTVPGDDFSRALFTVWFGPKPGDENLKRGMLGK
jgi:hypothetical protein